jgi:hypothetical protein
MAAASSSSMAGHATDLWLLAHPDTRYLGRMKAMFDFLRTAIDLPA